jgi:hypothetical protein
MHVNARHYIVALVAAPVRAACITCSSSNISSTMSILPVEVAEAKLKIAKLEAERTIRR